MARADVEISESVDELGGAYDPGLYVAHRLAASVPAPAGELPAELRDSYWIQGFLAVSDLLTAEQVRSAIAGIDHLVSGAVPEFRGIQWERAARGRVPSMSMGQRRQHVRKLVYYVDHEPRLYALAHDPAILRIAEQLLGAEPELFADQALLKPPGIGREKPWHQDKAFFDVRPGAPVVGLWIALDATDPDNGCMHVIPGSHHAGPIPHFKRRDFQICDTDVRRDEVIAVPLDPGGCLLFDGLMQHGTPMNDSRRRRWALQFHYARAADIWRTPEERADYKERRLAEFGGDGSDATC